MGEFKLYVYIIMCRDYGDSTYYPVFSHKKYTPVEFREICKKAQHELSEKYFYTDLHCGPDMERLIRDKLCRDYGFIKQDVTGYAVEDCTVTEYSYF